MALNKYVLFDQILRNGLYDDFIEFSIFMRWTKGYSFFNSALILLQRPGALYVENEYQWMKKYDRYILPDATPIVVMQPFGPVDFLYDFADTYGDNVPRHMRNSFILPEVDSHIGSWLPRLKYTVNRLGIYYGEKDYGSRQGGQAEFLDKPVDVRVERDKTISTRYAITVNKHYSPEQKATTILHEIGHILCGHLPIDKTNKHLRVPDRSKDSIIIEQKEFEAEKVCELICKSFGIAYCNSDYLHGYFIDGNEPYFSVRSVIEAADKFVKVIGQVKI